MKSKVVVLVSLVMLVVLSSCNLVQEQEPIVIPTLMPTNTSIPTNTVEVVTPTFTNTVPVVLPSLTPSATGASLPLPSPTRTATTGAPATVPGSPSGPYGVILTVPTDVLNIRSGPGVAYPVTAYFPATATTVMRTGPSATVGDATWVEVTKPSGGTGWVNAHFLTEYVAPASFCASTAVTNLIAKMDAWGIDVLFTSSQKCLALPPGLALCGVNERAMERAKNVPNRGWYFDFVLLEKHRTKDSTPMTPAMSLIFALDYQLDRILAEGLENRFARHSAMAQRSTQWAEAKGWPLLAPEGFRSQTLTVVTNPPEFDCADFNKFLAQRNLRLANGYGDLKGKTFRIAHMGEIQMADLENLLAGFDEYLPGKGL